MMTREKLTSYRRRLWSLGKVRTQAQFTTFLNKIGICLVFGSEEIPLPKVYDVAHDDADWWNWKDHLQASGKAYLGRLIRGKATLVTMDLLPAFLSLYYAQGGCASYDEEHYYGRLSQQAKWICDELNQHGPLAADRFRKLMESQHGVGTENFHKTLIELQRKFKIVTTGLVEKGWGTRIIGLFERWAPGRIEREAQRLNPEKSRRIILERLLYAAGALPVSMLPKLVGWPQSELKDALGSLFEQGMVRREVRPRCKQALWIVHGTCRNL